METQKTILMATLFFLTYLMWQSWQQTFPEKYDYKNNPFISEAQYGDKAIKSSNNINNIVPDTTDIKAAENIIDNGVNKNLNGSGDLNKNTPELITVTTDVVEYKINPVGGDISQVKLLKYNTSDTDKTPINLLNNNQDSLYVAPNGLTGAYGPDTQNSRAEYSSAKKDFNL